MMNRRGGVDLSVPSSGNMPSITIHEIHMPISRSLGKEKDLTSSDGLVQHVIGKSRSDAFNDV